MPRKKLTRLESVPEDFINHTDGSQKQLMAELMRLLNNLTMSGGKLVLSNENIAIVGEITEKLQSLAMEGQYSDGVVDFVKEFKEQGKITNQYFEGLSKNDFVNKPIYANVLKQSRNDAIALLSDNAIRKEFTQPLKQILLSGVTQEASLPDLITQLQGFVLGNPEMDGKLLRYVKQVSRDAFTISDRRYTNVVADDLGFDNYRYSGGSVSDTRDFCRQRIGKVFTREQVESWGNIKSWQGRIPGTNPSNIFEVAGGYNCMHSILPITEEDASEALA